MLNKLLTYIPLGVLAVSIIAGYTNLQAQTATSKDKVAKLEDSIEKVKDENNALEKEVVLTKSEQVNIEKKVDDVSAKTDKVIDMLLKMKEAK